VCARRPTLVLAVLAAAAALGACGGSDSEDAPAASAPAPAASAPATAPATAPEPAPAGTIGAAAYREDVATAQRALVGFATTLSSLEGPEELGERIGDLERDLDAFDGAIAELGGYRVRDAALEDQRSALARTGPPVSDVLRRFIAATAEEDVAEVQALIPEVQRAITDYRAASGAGAP
jgi:hypothetical protein